MNKTITLRFVTLMFLALSIWSCSDESEDEIGLSVQGYKAISSDSSYEKTNVSFLFFDISDTSQVATGGTRYFSGTNSEYQELKDDTFNLLQDGKIKLKSGETISAFKTLFSFSDMESNFDSGDFKKGKYVVAAIYSGSKYGHYWLYSTKYAIRNFEVKDMWHWISVVFPCDVNRYGQIDWVNSDSKFDYDF